MDGVVSKKEQSEETTNGRKSATPLPLRPKIWLKKFLIVKKSPSRRLDGKNLLIVLIKFFYEQQIRLIQLFCTGTLSLITRNIQYTNF